MLWSVVFRWRTALQHYRTETLSLFPGQYTLYRKQSLCSVSLFPVAKQNTGYWIHKILYRGLQMFTDPKSNRKQVSVLLFQLVFINRTRRFLISVFLFWRKITGGTLVPWSRALHVEIEELRHQWITEQPGHMIHVLPRAHRLQCIP